MAMQKKDFGTFLAELAEKADAPTAASLNELTVELQKERQEYLKRKLKELYNAIQFELTRLRDHRRREKVFLKNIEELQSQVNKVVSGESD